VALPILPIVAGVAVVVALVYVYRNNRNSPEKLLDKAQSAVADTAGAAKDAAETVADKASNVAKDVKRSVS
jgi:uncharacterized protein (UPF0333 family)